MTTQEIQDKKYNELVRLWEEEEVYSPEDWNALWVEHVEVCRFLGAARVDGVETQIRKKLDIEPHFVVGR